MTLKFSSLKKLIDFVRATHIANYELNTTTLTLTSEFLGCDINLALSYGAAIISTNPAQPTK